MRYDEAQLGRVWKVSVIGEILTGDIFDARHHPDIQSL